MCDLYHHSVLSAVNDEKMHPGLFIGMSHYNGCVVGVGMLW